MQKRVDEWDRKLRLFSETLDEWLGVQRGWMYLESIFKAADIQRQLPNEYKQFDQVNKLWLDLMRKTNTDPSNWEAIPAALAPRLNGRFGRGYDHAPAELKPTIMLTAKLEHAAREAKKR